MRELVFEAMKFAREAHKGQKRKYTAEPYFGHLSEVAGLAGSVTDNPEALATAWLHDVVEDQNVYTRILAQRFGEKVAAGVVALSDVEKGTSAEREAQSRRRLHAAEDWVQTIKVADIISNTSVVACHDPDYAPKYLGEKRAMLEVLDKADPRLREMAFAQLEK